MSQQLTSFSLTHVQYTPNDRLGFLCAGLSLAPVFLIVALVTATLARRDLHLFTGLFGQILNTVLNVIIKRIVRQPRPTTSVLTQTPNAVGFSPHGMPSNHAQFVFFFVGFWLPWILFSANNVRRSKIRKTGNGAGRGGEGCVVWRRLAAITICLCACAVVASRVYLHYHTVAQVSVGAVIGLLIGITWHWITWQWIVPVVFPLVVLSTWGKALGISDLSQVEDIVAWEHAVATTTDDKTWQALFEWRNTSTSSSHSNNLHVAPDSKHLSQPGTVSQLLIYPIKSCAGISISEAYVTPGGLLDTQNHRIKDRAWAIVKIASEESRQHATKCCKHFDLLYEPITIRSHPKMVLIQPSFDQNNGEMTLTVPSGQKVDAPILSIRVPQLEILLWNTLCQGCDQGDEVAKFLTEFFNSSVPLRLVHMDVPNRTLKSCSKYGALAPNAKMKSAFGDWSNYNILSQQSVDHVNTMLPSSETEVDAETYRPNVLVNAPCAFWEDGLELCSIGVHGATIKFAKYCGRCVLPTVNRHTGLRSKTLEPLKTLRKYRAGFYSHLSESSSFYAPTPFLGINCFFGGVEGIVRVGDVVQPLSTRSPFQPMVDRKNPFGAKYYL